MVLDVLSMANRLSMAKIHSIRTLHESKYSNREIARLLGVDRGTVNGYVRELKAQNRPDPHTGDSKPSQTRKPGRATKPAKNDDK
jgi:IS30 family transposase